jgi:hypothetical protein
VRLRAKDLKDKALLSGETQRGQEHGQKAGVIEGMEMPFAPRPGRRVKPGLVEPQFPMVSAHARRSRALATSPPCLCEVAAEGTLSTVSDHH